MQLLKRSLLVLAIFAVLCSGVYWLHAEFHLETGNAIALIGLLGAVVAVFSYLFDNRSKCHISNAYLTLGEDDGWIKFEFEAHVLNSGGASDKLQRIEYSFYHCEHGAIPLTLIFGGRIITENRGQILPLSLTSGVTYFVTTKESFRSDSPRGRQLHSWGQSYGEYIFRCKFVFQESRPIIVRVHPYDYKQPDHAAASRLEKRLGILWVRPEVS